MQNHPKHPVPVCQGPQQPGGHTTATPPPFYHPTKAQSPTSPCWCISHTHMLLSKERENSGEWMKSLLSTLPSPCESFHSPHRLSPNSNQLMSLSNVDVFLSVCLSPSLPLFLKAMKRIGEDKNWVRIKKNFFKELSKPVENFYEFIWAKLMTIARKQNLNGLRNAPENAVLHLILYIRLKGGGIRRWIYMKSTGGRLRGREKAKHRNPWDWIKSKMRDTSFTLLGAEQLIFNIKST